MLILASKSPRRRELLSLYTKNFKIEASNAVEPPFCGGDAGEYVKKLSRLKAVEVFERFPDATVLGADTVVSFDGKVLGKPKDELDAKRMLMSMSGKQQEVYTGICIISAENEVSEAVKTLVRFRSLSEQEIDEYIATGESLDKAGAYGIQGGAKEFVDKIEGDFFNVIGLPMKRVTEILEESFSSFSEC